MDAIRDKLSSLFFILGAIFIFAPFRHWWQHKDGLEMVVGGLVIGFVFLLLGAFLDTGKKADADDFK